MTVAMLKNELLTRRDAFMDAFGIHCSSFDMMYLRFSPYMFCKENRRYIIGMYLALEDFVRSCKEAKEKYDIEIIYYAGIDTFLAEYKNAVESCLSNI